VAALVAASALFPMLVAQLSIAAMIAEWTLGIGRQPALVAAALLLLLPPLLGGMRGVTVTALVQFLLALIVFVVVGVWMSAVVTGSSLPPVAYAIAIAEPSGIKANVTAGAIWNDAGLTLCVALGVASFPALLIRSATARSSASARSSIAWTLFVVAIFCGCAATMAALAKFALDATVRQASPASLFDVAPWISHWVDRGATLVTICGLPAKDAIATIAACATKPFAPGDLAISPDIAMLAAPDIAGLPQLASMLLATACLASTLAAASLVLFAIGAALGHDLYFRGLEPRAPVSRRLLAQRLSLLLAIGLASYVAASPPADYLQLALWSFAMAAAGLFPALVLAVWWKRANRWGALLGMLAGFAVAAYLIAAASFYPQLSAYLEQAGLADFVRSLGKNGIVFAAVPAGFVVVILVSLATPRPKGAAHQFAEALARPRDFPVDDERE
jgi:cation/acetate symporter